MSSWPQVTYAYDGTFAGFLTCVAESFQHREYPFYFLPPGETQFSLYPIRDVVTNEVRAREQYRQLGRKLTRESKDLVTRSFLTCLPQKERHIFDYIYLGFHGGIQDPTDDRVLILTNAIRHLNNEVSQLKGFVRFSDYNGILVGTITPKNRVLPLLRFHFCDRLSAESFLLFDHTHGEALCHTPGAWKLIPLEELRLDAPNQREAACRKLWKSFYDTIAIESRYNPKLRMSHMPKRYWANMTEMQADTH